MDKNILAVALGSMLLGGVAVAAYTSLNNDAPAQSFQPLRAPQPTPGAMQLDASTANQAQIAPTAPQLALADAPRVAYADVVAVDPVRKSSPRYASVIDVDPVRETSTTSAPREVCNDVVVQDRLPERDGNVGGTVAGALIGGLVGNRVGAGNGRKLATVAGAVGGGFIGNRVDRNTSAARGRPRRPPVPHRDRHVAELADGGLHGHLSESGRHRGHAAHGEPSRQPHSRGHRQGRGRLRRDLSIPRR